NRGRDFGPVGSDRDWHAAGNPALTATGQMLGTPDFVAPEQILDAQGADIRADIYSLGCTLYYLLSGGPPFPSETLYDVLQAHHSMDARPLNLGAAGGACRVGRPRGQDDGQGPGPAVP